MSRAILPGGKRLSARFNHGLFDRGLFLRALASSTVAHAVIGLTLLPMLPLVRAGEPNRRQTSLILVAAAPPPPIAEERDAPLLQAEPQAELEELLDQVLLEDADMDADPLPEIPEWMNEPNSFQNPIGNAVDWTAARFTRPRQKPESTAMAEPPPHESAKQPEPSIPDAEPFLLESPPPSYPLLARRSQWEGSVLCRLTVSANGSVKRVVVENSSGHDLLDRAAVDALLRWRFRPGTRRGSSAVIDVLHSVSFRLE